ncbi:inositol monophosphatase family protein [Nocardioides massiliensis]|uniref:Fructose-1,6-bisphosphatase/inositol monophosphatase family enzyme n=1 Tax=Nocardioides massiliensis TaxID=1325935 RepID=A0ABT9NQ34_9ACTN|nr:inositol monophosphatase family protein [Nocardioides massiliensis]MDP9822165.1 fructose-1,6-bisphosphatase/inositol monophosphatase family enzyme [Nocardioides massiliensis]
MTPDSADVDLAVALVRDAVELAARIRSEGDLDVERKTSVSDVVTEADHAAERLIVERLQEERPDDGVLGEEGAASAGTSGRRWVIDPVDGTYNFTQGSDYWCSAVALVDGDELLLGAVAHAASGRVVVGGPQLPTTADGEPVPQLTDRAIDQISVATYLHPLRVSDDSLREPFLRAACLPATMRMLGSGSMDMMGVATGALGCFLQARTPPWDWLPGAALVLGAGGVAELVDVEGHQWGLAGPRSAVDSLVRALAAAEAH